RAPPAAAARAVVPRPRGPPPGPPPLAFVVRVAALAHEHEAPRAAGHRSHHTQDPRVRRGAVVPVAHQVLDDALAGDVAIERLGDARASELGQPVAGMDRILVPARDLECGFDLELHRHRPRYESAWGGFLNKPSSLARASVVLSATRPLPPNRLSSLERASASRLFAPAARNGAGLNAKNSQKFRRCLSSTMSASVSRHWLWREGS